ncbi:hypothetical protein FRC02_000264 [Tulasnella sp. 418]|nr:hypothetical protein FRC02_000264 [Tulasnella sp. 418]
MVRTVVITGTSRGLGLEFSRQFAALPETRVIAVARRPDNAQSLKDLAAKHDNLFIVKADAANQDDIRAAFPQIEKISEGTVDLIINNAGLQRTQMELTEETPENIDEHLHNNVTGPIMFTNAVLPLMENSSEKRIIFVSSDRGSFAVNTEEAWDIPLPLSTYAITKAALHMVSRKYHIQLHKRGFTVISLSPGWCKTDLGTQFAPLEPKDAVATMIPVLNSLTLKDSGRFVNYDGNDYQY